jgi:hypothetical protein
MSPIQLISKTNQAYKKSNAGADYTAQGKNVSSSPATEPSLLCYLDISINEMNYHFNIPSDIILYNENDHAIIYFENEAAARFGWINFKQQTPDQADRIEFFEPGTGTFLILFRKANTDYPVSLTGYDDNSGFIFGHYTGIYTDAKDNPVYNVACSFCVSRHASHAKDGLQDNA